MKAYLSEWMPGNEVRMIIEDEEAGMGTAMHCFFPSKTASLSVSRFRTTFFFSGVASREQDRPFYSF